METVLFLVALPLFLLSREDVKMLEDEFTLEELAGPLRTMQSGNVLGLNGLPGGETVFVGWFGSPDYAKDPVPFCLHSGIALLQIHAYYWAAQLQVINDWAYAPIGDPVVHLDRCAMVTPLGSTTSTLVVAGWLDPFPLGLFSLPGLCPPGLQATGKKSKAMEVHSRSMSPQQSRGNQTGHPETSSSPANPSEHGKRGPMWHRDL
ncbi:hypothetical protein NDU88_001703 [Pleurodeles waltl]|uniref:Uncharacterized protein n=1 Tax=Pleurodeles waltl TaxID=8319 RepID=A0AAV7U8C9_PLEWA|nr:hypothetical protein NDU88_001703 [Pleurodeles waltl]